MICGSGGSKSRLAKAAGVEPCGQRRNEKLHAVLSQSAFSSQNVQNNAKHNILGALGSSDVEKWHAAVAQSTFWSQRVQNTTTSDHFWKFRCGQMGCRCGAKHVKNHVRTTFGDVEKVPVSQLVTSSASWSVSSAVNQLASWPVSQLVS